MTPKPAPTPPYLPPALLVAADYLNTNTDRNMTQAEADAIVSEVLKEVKR